MTTETQPAPDTTQADGDASKTAAEAGKTILDGKADDAAGKTAEDVETGDQGAETELTDEEKAAAEQAKADADKLAGPPEKYEFTMPEGVELDAVLAEAVDPVLRELGLNNEQANKLASTFAEYRVSEAQRQSDAYAQQIEDWGKKAKDDQEYGGAKFDENVPHAHKAIAAYGTPELKALLADGLGNHPEVIRFCYRVGKAMGEDAGVDAGNKAPPVKDTAAVLFNHPTSQPKR